MIPFVFDAGSVRRVLCLGAHSDDIEIGCGGTMLRLLHACPDVHVRWVVLSGDNRRAAEAQCGARLFLGDSARADIVTRTFRDGFFPYIGADIKEFFEELKAESTWDLIFTHERDDRHQDHRVVSDLTWNTFRNHMILEYEIPKYDGGLTTPNFFVPLDEATRTRKVDYLMQAFGSQRDKRWFTEETFSGLMRLRGVECAAHEGFAEGFIARKLTGGFSVSVSERVGTVR
jgi:LmbE family N-acetylglucosaminyl deacetylase